MTLRSVGSNRSEEAAWLDAIPEGPFRFRLGTRPGDAAGYFAATAAHDEIIAERRHWLDLDPKRYAALLPEGIPVLDAAFMLRDGWTLGNDAASMTTSLIGASPWERCLALGKSWEPDFALMRRDTSGRMILVGGCVCFPSNWRLTDKIGQPIREIHDVVPGLTDAIGTSIDNFLSRMKPGGGWTRSNWSVTRTSQRNQHPDLGLPELSAECGIDDVWLRSEDQALVSLPGVNGLLFGIRIRHLSFRDVFKNTVISARLRTAIESLSPEMLRYKNMTVIRDRLLAWLSCDAARG